MAKITANIGNSSITKTSQLINDGENSTSEYIEFTDLPSTFPPSTHTHIVTDISGTKSQFNNSLTDGDFLFVGDVSETPDATTTTKGKIKLAGDLGGTADLPTVPNKLDKGSYTGNAQDLKDDIDAIYQPDSLISTTEPIRSGNTFTFPANGYEVLLDGIRKINTTAFTTTIVTATDDFKRTDLIYFKPDNTLGKIQGIEDLSLTKIPEVPVGCIGISYIDVYGSTIGSPGVIKERLSEFIDDIGATELEIVKVTNKSQIVNKLLDVTKKYVILRNLSLTASESIWMNNSPLIEGLGADFITIETTEPNSTIFTGTNCQNFNLKNIALSPKGLGSKAFNLKDGTGVHEFRLVGVNFLSAESLGIVDNFRQWYCTDIGFYANCKDGFELKGITSGILFTETNLIGFASTGTLFKQGTGLSINDRVLIQINFSVPIGFVFMNFMPSVFASNEALQIVDCVAKVNGEKNDNNTSALFPNLSPNNTKCLWSGNSGLANTAIEKIVIAPAVTTNYVIDWLNDSYDITLTADTTFTEVNRPASGRRTKTLNITIDGNFTPTFPVAWELNKVGTYKKGELNSITIKFISTGKYAMKIDNTLSVYPAPRLGSILPLSLLPDSTSALRLNGSFFTPASIVKIEGQTVNSVIFDDDTGSLDLSVTTGVTEGDFDIEVSNGTNVVYSERLPVVLGVAYSPIESDFNNITGQIDLTENGSAKVKIANTVGTAEFFDIPPTINVSIRFKLRPSALGGTPPPFGTIVYDLTLFDKVTGLDTFKAGMGVYSTYNISKGFYNATEKVSRNFGGGSFEFRRRSNLVQLFIDGTLAFSYTETVNNSQGIRVRVKYYDIYDIKYIELAT